MREAILAAVRSGQMEDLRIAVELNEMKPIIADKAVADPIAHWRQVSADGEGREILAILGQLLDAGYTVLPIGKDLENNRVYVWPYFAEMKLDALTPAQEVELLRLVPGAAFRDMKQSGEIHALQARHRRRRDVAFFHSLSATSGLHGAARRDDEPLDLSLLLVDPPDVLENEGLGAGAAGLEDEIAGAETENAKPENFVPEQVVGHTPHQHAARIVDVGRRLAQTMRLHHLP